MPGNDCFTRLPQGFKVGLGITVSEFMIGNYRDSGFEGLG
jgi:hypothetical protein